MCALSCRSCEHRHASWVQLFQVLARDMLFLRHWNVLLFLKGFSVVFFSSLKISPSTWDRHHSFAMGLQRTCSSCLGSIVRSPTYSWLCSRVICCALSPTTNSRVAEFMLKYTPSSDSSREREICIFADLPFTRSHDVCPLWSTSNIYKTNPVCSATHGDVAADADFNSTPCFE